MKTFTLGLLGLTLVATLGVACGDDDDASQQTGGSGGTAGTATAGTAGTSGGGSAGASGAGGSAGAGGRPTGKVTVLATFDATKGELPEGLAVDGDGTPYVGFAPTGQIARLRSDGSSRVAYAKIPAPPDEKSFMTGLALDSNKNLYAALVSNVPATAQSGIYRIVDERGGGAAGSAGAGGAGGAGGEGPVEATTPWATHPDMKFPNGIAIDDAGKAKFGFVTDSAGGAIYRFGLGAAGEATLWFNSDELLKGGATTCEGKAALLDVGANGIVVAGNTIFVANTNKGTIVSVPRDPESGDALLNESKVFVSDCANLNGADGLAPDGTGGLYVAVNAQNKIVRVENDGKVTVIAEGGELDFPASLAARGPQLFVTNFALTSMTKKPALLSVEIPARQGR